MTEIGKMIREDGIKEGELRGKAEILIRQLSKKFKKVPEEYIVKLRKLPEYTIDLIATEIFDMEKIQDIEKYF